MAESRKTTYHIFREKLLDAAGTAVSYEPVAANVAANNSDEAIRASAKETGSYVAVPSRSFNIVPVTIETQTVVKLGTP